MVSDAAAGDRGDLALVLSGGGARAAYQVGVLRYLVRAHPDVRIDVLTGVSAGAINAAFLANSALPLRETVEHLSELWGSLTMDRVFEVDAAHLGRNVLRWGTSLVSGGSPVAPRLRGLVDARPLVGLVREALGAEADGALPGIAANVASGRLKAFALTTTSYSTGQTVTWVQGRDIVGWERSNRLAVPCAIGVEHVLASASLPLFFPAIRVDGSWYGDGGIRLAAPLSPALHLGASRLLGVSARHQRTRDEESVPDVEGYPPIARVAGLLLSAIFLDLFDQDADRLERINALLQRLPAEEREGMRLIDHVLVRPSEDVGRLANRHEVELPRAFRFLVRGLGSRRVRSNDMLSLVLFDGGYLRDLMDLGERDAAARSEAIASLVS